MGDIGSQHMGGQRQSAWELPRLGLVPPPTTPLLFGPCPAIPAAPRPCADVGIL